MIRNVMDSAKLLKQLEFLMGASKIGIDVIDSKFNIRYIDPAWRKFYGDPAGKKCYRYFMGRKTACPDCGVVKALRTKKIAVTEEALAKEGNRPIQVTTIPFRDDNGEWLVAETNVDITRIRRAEEALRSSEKRYRELFESSSDPILMADVKTRRIVDCNTKAEAMLGYPRQKILSMRVEDMHPEYAVAGTLRYFKEIAAGKRVFAEVRMLTARKHVIDVSLSASTVLIDGRPCAMGIFRDVTASKRADAKLREESSFRNLVISSAAEGIAVCHEIPKYPYVNFTVWNKRMTEITGYSMEHINRHGWYQTVYTDPAYREKARRRMERMRKGDDLRKEEWTISRSDGARRILQISTGVIRSSDGRAHVMAFMDDVTERRMADEVLERDRKELETLVEARSADLLRAQEELNKAKRLSDIGLLAATVAHEIRSPLAAIRTAAYNIKRKSGDPRLESHLANIEKKILESDQIIKNLLLYSNIKVPQREKAAVLSLMDECIELSELLFHDYSVSIRREYRCPGDTVIEADPVQLKEVFNNVLNNAYESLDKKKGLIVIAAWTDKGFLKIRVKDNGHGITPEGLKKVFEPFFSTKAKGIGLGLSLCYQIVTLHDGKMDIKSKAGMGTSVIISLPLSGQKGR